MATQPVGNITALLHEVSSHDPAAMGRLIEAVYSELRALARRQFRQERAGHLLQPTALVHEAWLRLFAHEQHQWQNRAHFFGAFARLMRRVLIDHARARRAGKRNGDQWMLLDTFQAGPQPTPEEMLALDDALDALEALSPRQARIVELRYFAGLSIPQIAEALALNARTVDRDWAAARAWLRRRLHR